MKHAVIVRFYYEKENESFNFRLNLFKNNMLKCIFNQTNQDFEFYIVCHPQHNKLFTNINSKIKTINTSGVVKPNGMVLRAYFNLEQFEKYNIVTRVDSDDLISDDFIETIVSYYNPDDKTPTLIHFDPIWLDYELNKQYIPKKNKYNDKFTSMFCSFINPTHFVYNIEHIYLGQYAKKIIKIPYGKCWLVVHGHNDTTHLNNKTTFEEYIK